jgi:hypothetical protein
MCGRAPSVLARQARAQAGSAWPWNAIPRHWPGPIGQCATSGQVVYEQWVLEDIPQQTIIVLVVPGRLRDLLNRFVIDVRQEEGVCLSAAFEKGCLENDAILIEVNYLFVVLTPAERGVDEDCADHPRHGLERPTLLRPEVRRCTAERSIGRGEPSQSRKAGTGASDGMQGLMKLLARKPRLNRRRGSPPNSVRQLHSTTSRVLRLSSPAHRFDDPGYFRNAYGMGRARHHSPKPEEPPASPQAWNQLAE